MKSLMTLIAITIISLTTWAHEGHDKTPGTLSAPHGGQLKGTSQLYIELVTDSSGIKIYTIDHDLKTIPIKDVKIEGTTQKPKQKQFEKLSFTAAESFLSATIDAQGSHRYTVNLKITYKGKTETVSFNVEPQD